MTYWVVYDNFQNAYISHVYKSDKYGIVILYLLAASLNVVGIVHCCGRLHDESCSPYSTARSIMGLPPQPRLRPGMPDEERIEKLKNLYDMTAAAIAVEIMKTMVVAMIFKNHTATSEEEWGVWKSSLHVSLALVALPLISVAGQPVTDFFRRFTHPSSPGRTPLVRLAPLVLSGLAFQLTAWWTDGKSPWWTYLQPLVYDRLPVLVEGSLLRKTICGISVLLESFTLSLTLNL